MMNYKKGYRMKEFFNITLKGMLIGISNIIPGVSGGTMAFVLGIYQKLTEAIAYFLIKPENRKEYLIFLCNLGLGIIIGFLVFAQLISFLLGIDLPKDSPLPFSYTPTFGFFLGLILGSIPVLAKMQTDVKFSFTRLGLICLGFASLFAISSLREPSNIITEQARLIKDFGLFQIVALPMHRIIWLFIIGIIAAFTMVIPGISGSALLIALGEYGPILNYISERSFFPIAIIGGGVIIGIILATLLMTKLLEQRPGATFYFILGLIFASCIQILLQMIAAQSSIIAWFVSIFTIITGIFLALLSSKLQAQETNK